MGALMGGLYWIIGRRNELAGGKPEEKSEEKPEPSSGDEEEAEK